MAVSSGSGSSGLGRPGRPRSCPSSARLRAPTSTMRNERWFYVRGDDVLVCDGQAELPLRGQHFLGMLGDRPCWAGDVEPPESNADDDGSFVPVAFPVGTPQRDRVDRRGPRGAAGRVGSHASLLRSLRQRDRPVVRRAFAAVPPLRTRPRSPARARDHRARRARRRQRNRGPPRTRTPVPDADVQLPRRLRRAGRDAGGSRAPRGARRGGHRARPTCGTSRASRGRSRTR